MLLKLASSGIAMKFLIFPQKAKFIPSVKNSGDVRSPMIKIETVRKVVTIEKINKSMTEFFIAFERRKVQRRIRKIERYTRRRKSKVYTKRDRDEENEVKGSERFIGKG